VRDPSSAFADDGEGGDLLLITAWATAPIEAWPRTAASGDGANQRMLQQPITEALRSFALLPVSGIARRG